MKYLPTFLITGTAIFLCSFGYPPSPLMEEVDKAWKENRASDIPTLIDKRLGEVPADTTALFLGYSYYMMWEFDPQNASTYRKKLEGLIYPIVDSIKDEEEKRQFEEWRVTAFPPDSTPQPAISEAQKTSMQMSIRELFKDQFPGTLSAQTNTKVLSRYLKDASVALGNDYDAFQKKKVAEIKKIGAAILISEVGKLGEGEENEILEEKWPKTLRSLEPVRVFATADSMTIWFYRMASTYDGVILHRQLDFKGGGPHTTYTNLGDGVVWFHSTQ